MSSNPDIRRWNEKYGRAESQYVTPCGEPELAELSHNFTQGLALEVACGRGANALYLATKGYEVVAVDGAVEGLKSCGQSASSLRLPVFPVVMDLSTAIFPSDKFELISVVRFLDRSLIPGLIRAIKPGGLIFYKTFNQRFLKKKPTFHPDYVLKDGELAGWFSDFQILCSNQDDPASTSSFVLAKKLVS